MDHSGVPNTRLAEEYPEMASMFKSRSIAEQNSLDLSWELLMDIRFVELRSVIFPTQADLHHFRQLVVNSVMATDIADKDLKALRNARWDKAFAKEW